MDMDLADRGALACATGISVGKAGGLTQGTLGCAVGI